MRFKDMKKGTNGTVEVETSGIGWFCVQCLARSQLLN